MPPKPQNPPNPSLPANNIPASLADALADLRGSRQEAADEKFPPPSDLTIQNAKRRA